MSFEGMPGRKTVSLAERLRALEELSREFKKLIENGEKLIKALDELRQDFQEAREKSEQGEGKIVRE